MQTFHLPYTTLPRELVALLKTNLSTSNFSEENFSRIFENKALSHLIKSSFPEFYDSKKLDKMIVALGWNGFRDRLVSLYVAKMQTGRFPHSVDATIVSDICEFEERFVQYSVNGFSRAYLLGFYLKMAGLSHRSSIKIPNEIEVFLRLSHNRAERIDILILILCHLNHGLGDKLLLNSLANGKSLDILYELLDPDYRRQMSDNFLAYSASINEPDMFLYEKV